jgi:hypothetical protein
MLGIVTKLALASATGERICPEQGSYPGGAGKGDALPMDNPFAGDDIGAYQAYTLLTDTLFSSVSSKNQAWRIIRLSCLSAASSVE